MSPTSRSPVVLVIRHTGLGDLMTSLPALRALRRSFPDHELHVTAPSWLVTLARRLHVADVLVSDPPAAAPDPRRHEDADEAIWRAALAGSPPPDVIVALRVPDHEKLFRSMAARAPRILVAYRHPAVEATHGGPEFDFADHILMRWERLLVPRGVVPRRIDLHVDDDCRRPGAGHTIVHVGAGSPARQWPTDRWARVARELEDVGHHVVFTGSPGEAGIVAAVREAADLPTDRDRTGTDAAGLADLIAGARLVVSGDTGPAHLAVAYRRRSVTLFGPTSPAWWGPPPGCPLHRIVWTGRSGDPYASRPDAGLLEIGIDEVLAAALGGGWTEVEAGYACPYLRALA